MSDYKVHIQITIPYTILEKNQDTCKVKKDGPQALGNEERLFFITGQRKKKKIKHVESFTFNGK